MMVRRNVCAVALVACSACGGPDHGARVETIKASLKPGGSPLVDHVTGPVVAWYLDQGVGYTLCADAATKQAPAWEQKFRAGIFICSSDEETPAFVLCISVQEQHAVALAFDEASLRLLGMADGPGAAQRAFKEWFAKLHAPTPACTSADPQ